MQTDTVIYWVRSTGPNGKDRVPMYYKGRCDNSDEGRLGRDVKARPTSLGPGDYTATYGQHDFETKGGEPLFEA